MNKTAIVIGATGLVGEQVVNQLSETDSISEIVTITRRSVEHPSAKVKNCVLDFKLLLDSLELFEADMLFSCLGTTIGKVGSIVAQREVDLDFQFAAAKLAAENGVEHYLLVSSSGADSNSLSAYLKMKGELEDRVQQLPFKRISIFQPSLLLGDRDETRVGESIASVILPSLCKLPGLRRYRPITGKQVAEKMVAIAIAQGTGLQRFTLQQVFP